MFQLQRLVNGNWQMVSMHLSWFGAHEAYCHACGTDPEFKLWYINREGEMKETHQAPGKMDMNLRIAEV